MSRVLIADDDVAVTNYLTVFLAQTERYDSVVVNDSRQALSLIEKEAFDAVILDMDMPRVSGLDILRSIHERGLGVPVIILTGVGDVDLAVKAMKLGAFDYMTKPADDEALLKVLDAAVRHKTITSSIRRLPAEPRKEDLAYAEAFATLPTQDPAMIRLFHEAERMAAGSSSIFLWGERGTYKELLARAIHSLSPRKNGPFVAADAAAIEPRRMAAELFGQARDWSGVREEAPGLLERAVGGTLFLDELDLLPMPAQVRLRRLLQTGEFYRENSTSVLKADVRLIAASHHDLTQEYYKEAFSRDLLYHLMLNSLRLPALSERPGDIPLLAEHFLKAEAARLGKAVNGVSPELMELLRQYDYPDNVRELASIIAAAAANEAGPVLSAASLPAHTRGGMARARDEKARGFRPRKLVEIEREHAARMVAYFNGDRERAAIALGMALADMEAILSGKA